MIYQKKSAYLQVLENIIVINPVLKPIETLDKTYKFKAFIKGFKTNKG